VLTYSELDATTRKRFIPALRDNIFGSNVLLYRLLKDADMGNAKDGGTKVIEPIEYAKNSNVGSYTKGDTLSTGYVSNITAAEFEWKRYYGSVTIDGVEELQNRGAARVIDFVAAEIKNTSKSLADDMATDMFSDGTSDAKGLVGIKATCDDGSNIDPYGGISISDFSGWAGTLTHEADTAFELADWRAMYWDVTVGNEKPTIIVTTADEMDAYENIFMSSPSYILSQAVQLKTLDGGWQYFSFKGVPIVEDSHCTANYVHFLNEDYLHFRVLRNFTNTKWVRPYDKDELISQILWTGALTCSNRRLFGMMYHD